jgi:uncharacterized protein
MRAGVAAVEVAGERLVLFPERLAWWERRGTLLVADPHWGKGAAFRAGGIPVPRGTTRGSLDRLDSVLERTDAGRVVFLGDFLHAREGRAPGTLQALSDWRRHHPRLELLLVRGNHDRHAGDPPGELEIDCADAPYADPPFVLAHYPDPNPAGHVLAGHLHPAVRLVGRGRQRERLPCFWLRPDVAILPSFGDFTGAADVQPDPADRVFVVAEDRVVELQ